MARSLYYQDIASITHLIEVHDHTGFAFVGGLTDTDGADASLARPAPTGVRAEPADVAVLLAARTTTGLPGLSVDGDNASTLSSTSSHDRGTKHRNNVALRV